MKIEFGYIENGCLYRNKFSGNEAMNLGKIDESNAELLIDKYQNNYIKLSNKLNELIGKIESKDNKGSYLSGILNIKKDIESHEGLGDYQKLLEAIESKQSYLEAYIQKNRVKNTEQKSAILEEFNDILSNNDIEEIRPKIKEIKQRWVKIGSPTIESKDKLEERFKEGLDAFYQKVNSFYEDKKTLIKARLDQYQEIINKIEESIELKKYDNSTCQEIQRLQSDWKEIGIIPKENFKKLNDSYWETSRKYFDYLKKYRKKINKEKSKNKAEYPGQTHLKI